MRIELIAAAISVVACVGACGSDDDDKETASAQELCVSYADASCDRSYECLTEAQRIAIGLPATVAACKTQLREAIGCEAVGPQGFCEGNQTFSSSEAQSCVSQWRSASCGQIVGADAETEFAPACGRVCTIE